MAILIYKSSSPPLPPHSSPPSMLPFRFWNWPLGSGEGKNRFSRWPPKLLVFLIYKSSWYSFLPSFKSVGLSVQEKKRKIDFQDGCQGSQFGLTIRTILAIFDLQDSPMLPTRFQVNRPFGSGEEAKNKFSRWLTQQPFWISDWNDFSYFWSKSLLHMLRTTFRVNRPGGVGWVGF